MLALIPLLPFAGFLLNTTFGKRLPKGVSGAIATAAMGLAFGVSVAAVWRLLGTEPVGGVRAIDEVLYSWIASDRLNIPLAFRLDPLSSVMILVITGIGTLIHLYSTAYMHEESDAEFARYFSYLNLFAAFMLVLVLGASFPVMFIGWEGVGLVLVPADWLLATRSSRPPTRARRRSSSTASATSGSSSAWPVSSRRSARWISRASRARLPSCRLRRTSAS